MTKPVYKNQSYTLTLDTDSTLDLTGATYTRILYEKPDGTKGYWDATVSGTKLSFDISSTVNDQEKLWKFQSYVEFASGKKYFGKIVEQIILNNLL
jgi:hypothetical protein